MTQTARVLELLRARPQGVTALDALDEVGSFRLSARILELRESGYDIETEWVTLASGKRIARYRLHEQMTLGIA